MMAAISIDRHVVCMEHDFNGMTLEYFWNFLLNEYIPAYRDELSEEDNPRYYRLKDKVIGTGLHNKLW